MPLKTILSFLTTQEQSLPVLRASAQLAEAHDAHLIGLHVIESLMIYPGVALTEYTTMTSEFEKAERAEAETIKAVFDAEMSRASFASEWRAPERGADPIGSRILESTRAADLIVVPQPTN